MAECIVASWYYNRSDDNINSLLEYLAKLGKTKILIKLSRCLLKPNDDVYNVFELLAAKLYNRFNTTEDVKKYDERITYIRTLSQNCWFSSEWLPMLYNTEFGPDAIRLMVEFISVYLKTGEYGYAKEYRDILEFLVCLTMV